MVSPCPVDSIVDLFSYPFTVAIIESLQLDDVGVSNDTHDLKLTVLEREKKNKQHKLAGMFRNGLRYTENLP